MQYSYARLAILWTADGSKVFRKTTRYSPAGATTSEATGQGGQADELFEQEMVRLAAEGWELVSAYEPQSSQGGAGEVLWFRRKIDL